MTEKPWELDYAQGTSLFQEGRYAEAEEFLTRALNSSRQESGNAKIVAELLHDLGRIYSQQGKNKAAEQALIKAVSIRERLGDPDGPEVRRALESLAGFYYETGSYDLAANMYHRLMRIAQSIADTPPAEMVDLLNALGTSYGHQDNHREAEKYFRRAVALCEQYKLENQLFGKSLNGLGKALLRQDMWVEAERDYQRALSLLEPLQGTEGEDVAESLYGLAAVSFKQGRGTEAEEQSQRGLVIKEKHHTPGDTALNEILELRAKILRSLGRGEEADQAEARIVKPDKSPRRKRLGTGNQQVERDALGVVWGKRTWLQRLGVGPAQLQMMWMVLSFIMIYNGVTTLRNQTSLFRVLAQSLQAWPDPYDWYLQVSFTVVNP